MESILIKSFHLIIFPGGIFTLGIALFMAGFDRILVARMQLRQGPPLLQPLYDTFKLFGKDVIVPRDANKKSFLLAPIIGLASIMIIPIFIPIYNNIFVSFSADIIVIIYLLTIPAVCLVVGGSSSASFFGGIGASREVVTMIGYELPMVMSVLAVCRKAGEALGVTSIFSMEGIALYQINEGMSILSPALIPAAIAFLMVIPAEVGVVPFDMAEAETEICEGPLAEYSGAYLGLYKLTSNIKAFVMSGLFVALFFGGRGLAFTDISIVNTILNVILFIFLILVVMFISISLVRAICGRFKINQGLKFFWTIPAALSVFSYLLVVLGL